ncbi:hypothetical protein BDW59DRAFT_153354 [Aspergillus cavernicola]|uniref:Actin-like ATPase domain-containing protein n=1 Tax=Aspergillus cavernicola TaxID=176166 RepID=A0ABR4HL59_9EURO
MAPTTVITIGIDFGATSSSAAYTLANDNDNGNNNKNTPSPTIQVLTKYPKPIQWSFDNLPRAPDTIQSIVYYDITNVAALGWSPGEDGEREEIVSAQGNLKSGVLVTPGFKSRLFPPDDDADVDPEGKNRSGLLVCDKSVDDITADFLRCFRRSVLLQVGMGHEVGGGNVRFVITVPAFWDDEKRTRFKEIARMAGFEDSNEEKLHFISGPEAALFHADSLTPSTFHIGDSILVLDCGGHIVETTIYEIKSKAPLNLERQTTVSVASYGSSEVTRRFMRIANTKIDKVGFPPRGRTKPRMRYRCKRAFEKDILVGLTDNKNTSFPLPLEVPSGFWVADLHIETDCPEADLIEGYMFFSEDEIYPCFDAVVARTLELVADQVAAMRGQGKQVQGCLLVGGFNRCVYYSRKIQAGIEALGLVVLRSGSDSGGVAKGAVLAGVDGFTN